MTHPAFRCGRLGILGSGRVARAFALGLAPFSRAAPLLYGRTSAHVAEALATVPGLEAAAGPEALLRACDLIVIAVSDDAVAAMAAAMAAGRAAGDTPLVLHTSGRSGVAPLAPLRQAGALTAAVHPAMTFTGDPVHEVARMAGAPFAVTADGPEATARALAVVDALGGTAFEIAEDRRALYHGALAHASNHLVTLLAGAAGALEAAGVDRPHALIAPLVRAAAENGLARGFDALSGPLLRGDAGTVAGHLETFARHHPAILPAYRAMALATVAMLEGTGRTAPEALRHLRALLDREDGDER